MPIKIIIDRSFCHCRQNSLFRLSIVTSPQLICDVTRTSIVTSYSSIILARANWHKSDLHQRITAVNINFSSPGIHGLARKKFSVHLPNHNNSIDITAVGHKKLSGGNKVSSTRLSKWQLDSEQSFCYLLQVWDLISGLYLRVSDIDLSNKLQGLSFIASETKPIILCILTIWQ